jgi:hypothetical protein
VTNANHPKSKNKLIRLNLVALQSSQSALIFHHLRTGSITRTHLSGLLKFQMQVFPFSFIPSQVSCKACVPTKLCHFQRKLSWTCVPMWLEMSVTKEHPGSKRERGGYSHATLPTPHPQMISKASGTICTWHKMRFLGPKTLSCASLDELRCWTRPQLTWPVCLF